MIIINIFIPIYTYNKDIHRYNLTEKIFKHYKNIQNHFKEKAIFQFIILGSELDISRELTLKYFKEDEYYEFDQNDPKYNGDLKVMFNDKIKTGTMLMISKKPFDINLCAGSNDYICYEFFEQIINYYNPDKPQIYGIDNYYNGKNAVFYCYYNGNPDKKEKCLTTNTKNNILAYWWDGLSSYHGREKYKYCGGIIGGNFNYYTTYKDEILEKINYDEGIVEKNLLENTAADKFISKELFYINIKSPNNNDISTYKKLLFYNKDNTIKFEDLTEKTKEMFKNELNTFINL